MNKKELEEAKQRYLENRQRTLEDFEAHLTEVQQDEPSVGGKIGGTDFRQFAAKQVFFIICEQEECVNTMNDSPYCNIDEEKKILRSLIKKAKKVFGKQYKAWYDDAKGSYL